MKNLLSTIVDSIPQGVLVLDCRGTLIALNKTACDIMNVVTHDIIGQSIRNNVSLRKLQLHNIFAGLRKHRESVSGRESSETRFRFQHILNGVMLEVTPFYDTGDLSGILVIIGRAEEDVPSSEEFRRKQERIAVLLEHDERMCREIDQNILDMLHSSQRGAAPKSETAEKGFLMSRSHFSDLASSIAKHISSPVDTMQRNLEVLFNNYCSLSDGDRVHSELEAMREQVQCISSMTHDLVTHVTPSRTERTQVNINSIVDNALAISKVYAEKTNIFVTKEHDLGLNPVLGVARNLERCFCNIIDNSVEAMSGEGRLSITTFMNQNFDSVFVKIADTGTGIDPEFIDRVLEPFFTTRKYRGAHGLVISISYAVLIEHHGDLRIESEKGFGTVVTVELPAIIAKIPAVFTEKEA